MKQGYYRHADTRILYDQDIFNDVSDVSFESSVWASRSSIIGFAEGRSTTFFVQHNDRELVLRHYMRGGLMARWFHDRYFWTGLKSSRPWQEWALLEWMHAKGLPVPQPVAARVVRDGWFWYRADLMTRRISQSRSVSSIIQSESLNEGHWIAIGSLIRRFHENGVYHSDLNANNILLDQGGRFYLIDFDKCKRKKPARGWQRENLLRLKRSLQKYQAANPQLHFRDSDWACLLRGYGWEDLDTSSR